MFLNSEADYAIRIVSCLVDYDERLDAASIAEKTGVTLRYSLKILNKLSQANIVKSFKGSKGGYVLAKSPESITLLEVIELICGPITFSRCTGEAGECTHPSGVCYFRQSFDDVSNYMRKKLGEVTFERK
ncbi:MAG: Rrf2 family transcriptional regulator [Ruminococcaceae bacterium]|nr:Rrf2 family transcriptional regulator [Oscillospiraceae bacterium]